MYIDPAFGSLVLQAAAAALLSAVAFVGRLRRATRALVTNLFARRAR